MPMKTAPSTTPASSLEERIPTSNVSVENPLVDLDDVVSAVERPYYQTWDEYETYVQEAIAGPAAAPYTKR